MMLLFKKIVNRILKRYQISRIETNEKVVYLTFDDGPEPGICEFVLDELRRYNFKATFFCRGDNAEKYPTLLQRIKDEGHAIGNHTFSHLHSFGSEHSDYCNDVELANSILCSDLFRPPYGSLSFQSWLSLKNEYTIYFWSLNSDDSLLDESDTSISFRNLIENTSIGDIVLFHFCKKHASRTRIILPQYLSWLESNGYKSLAL